MGLKADPLDNTASQRSSQHPPFCVYPDSFFSINAGFSFEVIPLTWLFRHFSYLEQGEAKTLEDSG